MKKGLMLLAGLLIVGVLFYWYKNTVNNDLKEKQELVSVKWDSLYKISNVRLNLLKELSSNCNNCDSLKIAINSSDKTRSIYSKDCSLDFVEQEYFINELFLNVRDSINRNQPETLYNKLDSNSEELNKMIDNYNIIVRDYNTSIHIFPHFFVVNKKMFKSKKYFEMQYGERNQNPVSKRKEALDMLQKMDTSI